MKEQDRNMCFETEVKTLGVLVWLRAVKSGVSSEKEHNHSNVYEVFSKIALPMTMKTKLFHLLPIYLFVLF